MTKPATILIIMGSVRAGRRCPAIAQWIANIAAHHTMLGCEIVDLAQWKLPMDDEPEIPATAKYTNTHTRAWSEKIAGADGFIIVTPQYNWGYPAPLKNALDHLHKEWNGKPLMLVTYGGHGGDKCAAQLRIVAAGLDMPVVPTAPALVISRAAILGAPFEADSDLKSHAADVDQGLTELAAALNRS
jgi:NAD(P)H-dependent FMN reductase